MPALDRVVIPFPAGTSRHNGFARLGAEWSRLAAEATAMLASLEALGRDVDALRRVAGEFTLT